MPYRIEYFSAPADMNLSVIPGNRETPPKNYEVRSYSFQEFINATPVIPTDPQKLQELIDDPAFKDHPVMYYYCHFCKGWIAGEPNSFHENTISLLSGREGDAYHCKRCGSEIGFSGKMS